MTNNNAYCYYEDLGANHLEDSVMELWHKTWKQNGWNPVVIGKNTAQMHPKHDEFVAAVSKFPTVNPTCYELACYRRHLAMVVIGGGMLTDYDVMNISVRPEDLPEPDDEIQSLDQSGAPAPSFGTKKAWQGLVDFLQAYQPAEGTKHMSDMLVLQHFIKRRHAKIALTLFEEGWKSAPMIHFPNAAVVQLYQGVKRSDLITSTLRDLGFAMET